MGLTLDSAPSGQAEIAARSTPGMRVRATGAFTTSPALILAASFAVGIGVAGSGHEFAKILLRVLPFVLSAAGLSLLLGLCFTRAGRDRLALMAAILGFTFAGFATALQFPFRFPPNHVSNLDSWGIDLAHPVRLAGRLAQDPLPTPSGLELDLEATALSQGPAQPASRSWPAVGRVRLWVRTTKPSARNFAAEFPSLNDGDSVEAVVRLTHPRVYRNAGSFDFRRRAESIDDLYWEATVEGPVRKLQSSTALSLGAALRGVRNLLGQAIDHLYPPWSAEGRSGAVLKAVLLGDRSSLDSGIVEPFRQSGLYHLLVIAGLHVGLLAFLVTGALRLIGLRRTSRNLVLLTVLVAYAAVVEQRAPTLRATTMLGILIVARLLDRDHSALNAIGLAALALLFTRPPWLYDSGFQLSFAAALVIAGIAVPVLSLSTEPYRRALSRLDDVERDTVLAPRLAQLRLDLRSVIAALREHSAMLGRHPEAAQKLVTWPLGAALAFVEIVIFSAILQIGLLLPMVETFHRVTLAGIGLNALALPLMTVLLAVAFPTVLLAIVSPVAAAWPAKVVAVILGGLFSLSGPRHLPDWLSFRVPAPAPTVALGFALTLLAIGVCLPRSRRALLASALAFAVFAALLISHPFAPHLPANSLEITALDCGRGQAIFLVLPDGATVLVGAGGSREVRTATASRWDPGENIVSPYLWSRGIQKLDVVIVMGGRVGLDGVSSILQNFRVRELWCPRGFGANGATPPDEALVLTEATRRGAHIREVSGGETLMLGRSSFQILTPLAETTPDAGVANDPIALRVSAGDSSALVAGMLSAQAEHQILESGADIRSEVLAAPRPALDSPQHGWFLERVAPRIVIQTAGRTEEIAQASGATGAPPLSTDRDGAITAEMRGPSLRVSTFRRGYVVP